MRLGAVSITENNCESLRRLYLKAAGVGRTTSAAEGDGGVFALDSEGVAGKEGGSVWRRGADGPA